MSKRAYYVYDVRKQYDNPEFVVYEQEHVAIVAASLFSEDEREHLHVSLVRLHDVGPKDPYITSSSSVGRARKGKIARR